MLRLINKYIPILFNNRNFYPNEKNSYEYDINNNKTKIMKNLNLQILLIGIAIVFVYSSCMNDERSYKSKEASYSSGLLLDNIDTTIKPGDNFYMYANGMWIKNAEIPAGELFCGVYLDVVKKNQEDVKKIIEESASADSEFGTDEQKVGDLYASYMDMEKRNELGITPLLPEFEKIDALSGYKDLAKYFAYANKFEFGNPFELYVDPDRKEPTQYAVYNWQGGLGLPDREYYLSDDGKFPGIREEYVDHMAKMMNLAGLENAVKSAYDIMALETKLAAQHMKKEDTKDVVKTYNIFPVDSLDRLMPAFDWKGYLTEAGVPDTKKIVISQPGYTLALNDIITSIDMDTWKLYLKWGVIKRLAGYLNESLDEQDFRFYGTVLNGTKEQQQQWRRAVKMVNYNLGQIVGKIYVKKHFPPEAKERMLELVDNILKAYEVSIKELDWMSEETKKQALDKLSKITPIIGYPDKWKDYSAVTIKSQDLVGNINRCRIVAFERDINKYGGPIDKTGWGKERTPQTMNAFYTRMNEIIFTAASLQPPFFDLNADGAANYGTVGSTIAHEISHLFDDQGSAFDGDGAMRNWWTDEDREEFRKRTKVLVVQYDAFKVFDDLNVNGALTLGENMADLGGLSIAIKAYKMSLGDKEAPVMDGYTGIQRVFMLNAQTYRAKIREEVLRKVVNTDTHTWPPKFRVNGVVRNIPEFYTAFNVQPGDSLYLPPEERVKIW